MTKAHFEADTKAPFAPAAYKAENVLFAATDPMVDYQAAAFEIAAIPAEPNPYQAAN